MSIANLFVPNDLTLQCDVLEVSGYVKGSGTSSVAVNANAGTSALAIVAGSQTAGSISLTTGSAATAPGILMTVTSSTPFPNDSFPILLYQTTATAAGIAASVYAYAATTTTWDIYTTATLPFNTLYIWSWTVPL
jgi:hypothetical protein